MSAIRIEDIATLAAVAPGPLAGDAMRRLRCVDDAVVLARDGRISWFGPRAEAPPRAGEELVSAAGGTVVPGLIDCHTHIPFAGERCVEFARRVAGESYLSIMQSGGGIRVTTAAVRSASREQLVAENLPRLRRMLAHGVTTVECKSGYGLTPADEIKQLEAVRELARLQPLELAPTYLGAHALPAEYEGRADEFIEAISATDYLHDLAGRGLARFCDVFCDRGAFDVPQARRVLERGLAAGLRPKLHADELAQIGATRLAGELRAVSADHLEHIDDGGIAALRAGGVIPVVLPGTSFFLGIPHCDARRLIGAGLPVAVATDLNPGSCHIDSLPLIMQIACCQLRLAPAEALAAVTANAAAALDLHGRKGAVAVGFDADLTILATPNLETFFYRVGEPHTRAVIKAGRVVYPA